MRAYYSLFLYFCFSNAYNAPFLKRKDMIGIWKVSKKVTPPFPSPSEIYKESICRMGVGYDDEVVLRLNDDGTFDPYTEPLEDDQHPEELPPQDLHHMLGRGGRWEYREYDLLLAAQRPENWAELKNDKIQDTLFRGQPEAVVTPTMDFVYETVLVEDLYADDGLMDVASDRTTPEEDMDVHLAIPQGQIKTGRFLYPQKHQMFFDEPILLKGGNNLGFFHMNQLLGKLNAVQKPPEAYDDTTINVFQPQDFYNRTFYLAAAEYPVSEQHVQEDKHCDPDKNPPFDVRVLQVQFFQNNTFAATGMGKTLRGKYGITGELGTKIWFQVSIFGAGRDVSGSVYSEGRFVGQQDKRGYVGSIQAYPNENQDPIFYIYGEYYEGMWDLEKVRTHESAGTFVLQEVDLEEEVDEDEMDIYDGDLDDFTMDLSWYGGDDAFQ